MGPQRASKAHARHVGRAATLSTGTREHRVILITQPHLWRRPHLALWGRHREGEGPSLLPGARETSSAFLPTGPWNLPVQEAALPPFGGSCGNDLSGAGGTLRTQGPSFPPPGLPLQPGGAGFVGPQVWAVLAGCGARGGSFHLVSAPFLSPGPLLAECPGKAPVKPGFTISTIALLVNWAPGLG